MTPAAPSLDELAARMNRLEAEQAQQRQDFNLLYLAQQHFLLGRHHVAEAITEAVVAHFGVTFHQLEGRHEARKPGRRPQRSRPVVRVERTEEARFWLLCLLRQLSGLPYEQIKLSFPWVTSVRFMEAGEHLHDLLTGPDQANRSDLTVWRDLLHETRVRALALSVDTVRIDEELHFARPTLPA